MNLQQPLLTIVIPCYNEEDVFAETAKQLTAVLDDLTADKLISAESKLLFVDDGSTDRTWPLIAMESTKNRYVTGLKLARNSGHQKALLAGLDKAKQNRIALFQSMPTFRMTFRQFAGLSKNIMKAMKSSTVYAAAGKRIHGLNEQQPHGSTGS